MPADNALVRARGGPFLESFIVRVWVSEKGAEDVGGELHGKVVHLASGTSRAFTDAEELLATIRTHIGVPVRIPETPGQERVSDAPA